MGHHLHLVQGFAAGLRIPRSKTRHSSPRLPSACRAAGLRPPRRRALALRLFSDQPAGVAVGAVDHPVTGHGASPSVQVAFRLDLVARSAASVAQRKSCRRPARSLFWHAVPVVARLRVARVAAQENNGRNAMRILVTGRRASSAGVSLASPWSRACRYGSAVVVRTRWNIWWRGAPSSFPATSPTRRWSCASARMSRRWCIVPARSESGDRANASWRPTSGLPRASSRPACGKRCGAWCICRRRRSISTGATTWT